MSVCVCVCFVLLFFILFCFVLFLFCFVFILLIVVNDVVNDVFFVKGFPVGATTSGVSKCKQCTNLSNKAGNVSYKKKSNNNNNNNKINNKFIFKRQPYF